MAKRQNGLADLWNNLKNGFSNWFNGENWSAGGNDGFVDAFMNMIGQGWNSLSGSTAQMEQQDAYNKENAALANQYAMEQMKYQSELNSVGAKATQLSEAGLNPALAGGVSNSTSGASASTPSSSPASGSMGQVLNSLGDFKLKMAQAKDLEITTKLKQQEYDQDLPTIQWLGMQADAQHKLSQAQYYQDLASYYRYQEEWLAKTETERLALMNSEKNRNEALARYNNATAVEQEAMNTQLDEWIDLLPADKRADLDKKLAEAEHIHDANERANVTFWAKATALVAGNICMFVPGAQGVGIALLASAGALHIGSKK